MRSFFIVTLFVFLVINLQAQKGTQLAGMSLNYSPQSSIITAASGAAKTHQSSYLIQPFFLSYFRDNQAAGAYLSMYGSEHTMLQSSPLGTQETFVSDFFLTVGGMYRLGHRKDDSNWMTFMQVTAGVDFIKRRTQNPFEIQHQPGFGISTNVRPGVSYQFNDAFCVEAMLGSFRVYLRQYYDVFNGQTVETESDFSLNASIDLPTLLVGCTFVFK